MYRLRVKEVLEAKGISPSWIIRHTRLARSMVRRMVQDPTYMPPITAVAEVAKVLGVRIEDLIEEIPDPPPPFARKDQQEEEEQG
ncbi:helix-turn-helix domain-containing protein [Thermogemmatispora onikobensis]|uniref:helix-turn-helix domain-containing protein n=1 Tax=Thermogemmatispora onikobensis TaxID=732234 RepID=UPI000A0206D6|nr:helix-turn-helix transcriptional regulator [Thermogemmatispora onikobensis]